MAIYQLVVKALMDSSEDYRNIHHYNFPDGPASAVALQEAVDSFDTILKTNLQAFLHSGLEVVSYDVRRVDVGNEPTFDITPTGGSWIGTAAGAPLPFQIAVLTTFKAQTTFPRTTRTYMFPNSINNVTANGRVSAGLVAALEAWGDSALDLFVTGITDPVKVAVSYGGTPRAVTAYNEVQTVNVSPIFATQRRRRVGVGI